MEKAKIKRFKAKSVEIRWIKKRKSEIKLFLILVLSSTLLLRSFEINNSQNESNPQHSYYILYSYAYESDFSWVTLGSEFSNDITIDEDNNIYFAGGDLLSTTQIGKFDSMGHQLWNLTVDQGNFKGVALDSFGNLIGITGSNIFKVTSNGELNWLKSLGVTLHSIVLDSNDDIYLATEGENYFLMKCNSSGELMWNATWSGMITNEMQIDSEQNLYLGGSTSALGAGRSDAIVAKFNSTGSYIWHKTFGGLDNEFGNALAIDSSDNVYLGGSAENHFGTDMFVAKYDENATYLYHYYAGASSYYESCRNILLRNESYGYPDQGDFIFLCGVKYYGGNDRYFCIYSIQADSNHFASTFHEWLGPENYVAYSSAFDSNENIWIGGYFRGRTYGNYDTCVARFGKDSDREGLSDDQENNLFHTNPDRRDSDYDGLTDYEEVRIYNTNPNNQDTDADGLNDKDEILKGFDPNDPFSNDYVGVIVVFFSSAGAIFGISIVISLTRNYITKKKHRV